MILSCGLLAVWLLPVLTAGKCSKFEPSEDFVRQLIKFRETGLDPLQISSVVTCPSGNNRPPANTCGTLNGNNGCPVLPEALFSDYGVINAKGSIGASPTETLEVFDLVNGVIEQTKHLGSNYRLFRSARGCFLPHNEGGRVFYGCIREGRSGYLTAKRVHHCANGTLSGCDSKGSFRDGPVQVCAPRVIQNSPFHSQNQILSIGISVSYINDSQVEAHKTYPAWSKANRKECKRLTSTGSAHASSTVSWLLIGVASALSTSFVILG